MTVRYAKANAGGIAAGQHPGEEPWGNFVAKVYLDLPLVLKPNIQFHLYASDDLHAWSQARLPGHARSATVGPDQQWRFHAC
jgi:hypothetical protein